MPNLFLLQCTSTLLQLYLSNTTDLSCSALLCTPFKMVPRGSCGCPPQLPELPHQVPHPPLGSHSTGVTVPQRARQIFGLASHSVLGATHPCFSAWQILNHPSKPNTDVVCSGKPPTLSDSRQEGSLPHTLHASLTVLSTCPEGSVAHLWRFKSPVPMCV